MAVGEISFVGIRPHRVTRTHVRNTTYLHKRTNKHQHKQTHVRNGGYAEATGAGGG